MGEPDQPCGARGICSLRSGTCDCDTGYMSADCGECAKGYARVDEHCVPHLPLKRSSTFDTLNLLWPLLALVLCCGCGCCAVGAHARRRRHAAERRTKKRFAPHARDLALLQRLTRAPAPRRNIVARHAALLRPDLIMHGGRARRASAGDAQHAPGEAQRMRALTGGGTTWPMRRAATVSGGEAARLLEVYSDGRLRQRALTAYSTDVTGALAFIVLRHLRHVCTLQFRG